MKSFRPKLNNLIPTPFKRNNNPDGPTLRLIPLGGVGDVTKNMYVYEYGEDIIIVDCGIGFPEQDMLGVDLVIPDISYLRDKIHKIRAIVITHGHDDHIGSLPYLWPELKVPIYSQKLTSGLIRSKFTEHNLPKDAIKEANLTDSIKLGVFDVSFYQVSHSIPDSTGIVIRTPVGNIIHQADFKMDWTPVNGQVTDVASVAEIGREGVILMTIDCLRVEKQGYTLSEKTIEDSFEKIEQATAGKVLITMTSSNVTRIQQAINVAVKSGRKIAVVGRSMINNFQVAWDLGYLDVPAGLVIPMESIKKYKDDQLLILIAGSQGQPGSSLSRAANNDHKFVTLGPTDSIVFSADPIPSTESIQYALIDTLTNLGCDVYYSSIMSDLHVSGHAASEEIKLMLNLAKPKYILGIGGQYRHMKALSKMCQNMGYNQDQILMAHDGDVINISKDVAKIEGEVPVANVYVDGLGVGDVGSVVLRDRQVMSEEGVVVVVLPFDSRNNEIVGEPDIISRGFIFEKDNEEIIENGRKIVRNVLSKAGTKIDWRYIRHQIEEQLERYFYQEIKRNPLIVTIVTEV